MKYAIATARQTLDVHKQKVFQIEDAYSEFLFHFDLQILFVSRLMNVKSIELLHPSLVLLPGGGDVPSEYYDSVIDVSHQNQRDSIEKLLIEYSIKNDVPLLGICRGMQMINGYLGGKITRDCHQIHPVAVCHKIKSVNSNEEYEANSYHRDIILKSSLSNELTAIIIHKDLGHVEAFTSDKHPILGLQWHPERSADKSSCKELSVQLIHHMISGGNQ